MRAYTKAGIARPSPIAGHSIKPSARSLNDSAFIANTVVGKQQARVIVIFLPMEYLLTKAQAKKFYSNPETVFGCPDLRLLEATAEGNFITAVTQK